MQLSRRIEKVLSKEFVVRINEVYHDLENSHYQERQQLVFDLERKRWQSLMQPLLSKERAGLKILDYGTGTGFVPLSIQSYLQDHDHLVCMDVSSKMLKVCETNLESLSCKKEFLKTDGFEIDQSTNSIDIIVINAVLHHLPDLNTFSTVCQRILKPNGLLVVVHEPHKSQGFNFWDTLQYKVIQAILNPKDIAVSWVENSIILEKITRPLMGIISSSYRKRNKMLVEISNTMKKEGWISFDLRGTEIQHIVDIHIRKKFTYENIKSYFSPNWELIEWETFNIYNSTAKLAIKHEDKLKKKYLHSGRVIRFTMKNTKTMAKPHQ